MAVTAKDLLEKRKLIQERKGQKVIVETPLGDFLFKIPSMEILQDAKIYEGNHPDQDNQYCLYKCCLEPDLKDETLQKELNKGGEPVEIVNAVFLPGEVMNIAEILIEKAGYNKENVKAVEGVKN